METKFIPKSFKYSKELSEKQAAKDTAGEQEVQNKINSLKEEFNISLKAAREKSQIVQDKFHKYLHRVFSFPINDVVKTEFVKAYQANILNLGQLKKTVFPTPNSELKMNH